MLIQQIVSCSLPRLLQLLFGSLGIECLRCKENSPGCVYCFSPPSHSVCGVAVCPANSQPVCWDTSVTDEEVGVFTGETEVGNLLCKHRRWHFFLKLFKATLHYLKITASESCWWYSVVWQVLSLLRWQGWITAFNNEFCLLLAPILHLTNSYRPGIWVYNIGVALRHCGGHQIAQNASFYIMLL